MSVSVERRVSVERPASARPRELPGAPRVSACPFCGAYAAPALEAWDRNRETTDERFVYDRCPACATAFLANVPADLGVYYGAGYHGFDADGEPDWRVEPFLREVEAYRVALLRRHVEPGALIEIGAGAGGFAAAARDAGFDVTAIEMDSRCCEYLDRSVGVNAVCSDRPLDVLASLPAARVVAMWHVLEHLPNPAEALAAAAERLEPGGILAIGVPNPRSLQFRLLGSRWAHLDAPRHLCLVPIAALIERAGTLGLHPVVQTTDDPFGRHCNIHGWSYALRRRPGVGPASACSIPGLALTRLLRPLERRAQNGSATLILLRKDGPLPAAGDELPGLEAMLHELRDAPEIFRSSRFWEHHAELQYRELAEQGGFAAFKRTVNRHFFQFMVTSPRDPQFRAVVRHWARRPNVGAVRARLREPLAAPARSGESLTAQPGRRATLRARISGRAYAVYVAMLAAYTQRRDRRGVFDALAEPALGQPTCVRYQGRAVSEDLCNSVLEYTSILDAMPSPPRLVVELGSGYGRLAWVFLRAQQNVRYVLVDIPPGLAIAQRYLTELLPERRAFRFRRFGSYAEVADEFESAQIAFLTPNQLELMPSLHADLFVNVSSLHEMRREQIQRYFQLLATHCDGFFYTKQWLRSINPFDDLVVRREDYPVPAEWRAVFDRVHPVQTHFFEALYALGSHETQ